MKIIALVAPKQAGKDASFDVLKKNKLVDGKIAFANPLKALCSEFFNLHPNLMHDADLKELPLKEPIILRPATLRKLKHKLYDYLDPYVEGQFYNVNKAPIQGLENRVVNTPRELLQIVGTDLIRDRIYKDWHLKTAFNTDFLSKKRDFKKDGTYVVTDCRFLNEYEFLKTINPNLQSFYIERPEAEQTLQDATHQSELETIKIREAVLKDGGSIIKNDGSLKDLEKTVLKALKGK